MSPFVEGLLTFLLGLTFTLFGMNQMSHGLERMSGGKLENVLESATTSKSQFPILGRLKGMIMGCGITALVQSSSSTTVMTVGFVNSGMMKLEQAVGIIMGANIGTTITLWILALTGLESDLWYVEIFKPSSFSPVLAIIGIALLLFSKKNRRKDLGITFVSFAVLMFGMSLMSDTCSQLANNDIVTEIFVALQNPILGLLVGAAFTGVIQASAATIGIVQALAVTGAITYSAAIPIILGANIGTCVTALISCIGANRSAKRTAVVHLMFNIVGSIVLMAVFYGANAIFDFPFMGQPLDAVNIALIHTIFNVAATALLLPMGNLLAKLAYLIVKDKPNEKAVPVTLLDSRFLATPGFAIEQCGTVTDKMARLAKDTLSNAFSLLNKWDDKLADTIAEDEEHLDRYEDKLGTYLVRLSEQSLDEKESRRTNQLLHVIGDFERIGDHALNILDSAREIKEKNLSFSPEAKHELSIMIAAVEEIVELSFNSYFNNDVAIANRVEPLEDIVDALQSELRARHVNRLQRGECTIQLGFVFNDLISNFERVADHCSNIAVDLIEVSQAQFNTHSYLNALKLAPTTEYERYVAEYTDKYKL
ncbi:MAG: Na/Pi cotransporter family protein [Clostridia bacterium]|nr:Na/Pi cotransporter family protein [Clostridia bacterium]